MCQAFTLYSIAWKIKARFVKTSILLTLVAAIGCSVFAARGGFENPDSETSSGTAGDGEWGATDALTGAKRGDD
jgi:hypothetical protein